jgi:hypothetical protein
VSTVYFLLGYGPHLQRVHILEIMDVSVKPSNAKSVLAAVWALFFLRRGWIECPGEVVAAPPSIRTVRFRPGPTDGTAGCRPPLLICGFGLGALAVILRFGTFCRIWAGTSAIHLVRVSWHDHGFTLFGVDRASFCFVPFTIGCSTRTFTKFELTAETGRSTSEVLPAGWHVTTACRSL